MTRPLAVICLAFLAVIAFSPVALAQEFDPRTYTCDQFIIDGEQSNVDHGYAVLWGMGWFDNMRQEPAPVTRDRIRDLAAGLLEQCAKDRSARFVDAFNEILKAQEAAAKNE